MDDNIAKTRRSTGKCDISGQEVFENDIIERHMADRILEGNLIIRYGTWQAFCPVDQCFMDSVGFYTIGEDLPDMPIGPLEDYACVIGNLENNKELVPWFDEKQV